MTQKTTEPKEWGTPFAKVHILIHMIRNYWYMDIGTAKTAPSIWQFTLFILNVSFPYTMLCWLFIKLTCATKSQSLASVANVLMSRGLLYGGLRHLRPEDREAFSGLCFAPQQMPPHSPSSASTVADKVRDTGFASLGLIFNEKQVRDVLEYFQGKPGYKSQVPLQSDGIPVQFDLDALAEAGSLRYFCFDPKTSLGCPIIRDFVRSPVLLDVARSYLKCEPTLYGVNSFATFEGASDHYVMKMHRDYDDFRFLTFFVCWTTTSRDNGATVFVPGSHQSSDTDPTAKVYLSGHAGTVFAVDTFGLHAGNRHVDGVRFATWIRFGSIPNLATIQDKFVVPDDAGAMA